MKKFFQHPVVKNLSLSILAIIVGGAASAMGGWQPSDANFSKKLWLLIIFSCIYIATLIYYSTFERNINTLNKLLTNQNKAFEDIMVGIMTICTRSANKINISIHKIIEEGNVDLNIWSFDEASSWVCKEIYTTICDLNGVSKDFTVCYVRLVEENKPENLVYMNAYFDQTRNTPKIYNKRRNINDSHSFHDARRFKENNSDIEALIGYEKIDDLFSYSSISSKKKNKKKYNQYISIPVFCNDKKMIGLLEVVCLNKASLAETEEELLEFAKKYIVPYSFILLLLHKLEKALLALPPKQIDNITK